MNTLKKLFAYLLIVLFISIFFQSLVILFIKYSKEDTGRVLARNFQNSFLNNDSSKNGSESNGAGHFLKTLSNVVTNFSNQDDQTPEKMVISVQRSSQIEEYRPQVELESPFVSEKIELKPVKILRQKNNLCVDASSASGASASEVIDIPYGKKIIFHTLSRGEKLSDLAKLYSIPVETIKKFNGFSDNYRLFAGQKIMIIQNENDVRTVQTQGIKSSQNTANHSVKEPANENIDEILKSSKSVKTAISKKKDKSSSRQSAEKPASENKKNVSKTRSNSQDADPLSDIIKSAKNKRRVFKWPVRGVVRSKFGMRIHPVYGKSAMHTGIDIAARKGKPIKPSMGGTVIFAGWLGGYGKLVEIKHPKGYTTRYAHMSVIKVKKGQAVTSSTVIGNVGDTGTSTGYHLHFEIRKNGKPLNPAAFIRN